MKRESGQALVLVLLSLAVVLTLVLFILSRSVTDILVSSKNQEAVRAFSAAEAGIEQALVIGTGGANPNFGSNAGYTSTVADFASGSSDYQYPIELSSGDSMTVWFVSHDPATGNTTCADGKCFAGTALNVCFGKPGTGASTATTPAIEVSVFYEATPGTLSTIKIGRAAYDPNVTRVSQNNFTADYGSGCSAIAGGSYAFQQSINFADLGIPGSVYGNPDGLQFARIRMFYNTDQTQTLGVHVVGVNGLTLPSQGQSIISTGTAGQSSRRIDVFQGWPEPPSVFDNAIYSSTGLTK